MIDTKIIKFFQDVLSKKKEGKIPWEPTAQEASFIAAIGGQFTLAVSAWNDPLPGSTPTSYALGKTSLPRYALVLRDEIGRELARVTELEEGISPEAVRELYESARQQAMRPGERINDALEALKSL